MAGRGLGRRHGGEASRGGRGHAQEPGRAGLVQRSAAQDPLPLVLADDITVGGQSIAAFVGTDGSAAGTVEARIDRMKTRALAWKQTANDEKRPAARVAIDFVGKEDATRIVWLVGQHVTVTGKAEEAKEGPVLITDDGEHPWIDAVKGWPRGKRVKVSGQAMVKHDRPVFVPQPGQPIAAGVLVPAGTDLRAASQRLLIGAAQWTTVDSGRAPLHRFRA